MNHINVAIVGSGFMGWVHTEALRRIGVSLLGICGSSPEKSRLASEKFGIECAYDSYEDVLGDRKIHAIHITTPNQLHFDMVQNALRAGKHVLCEKPLAMNASESAELVRISNEHPQQVAGVNYNVRYYPLCLESREMARLGKIGDIVHVTGSYSQDWLTKATDYNWRVLADQGGKLRAVADIGTHLLDLVQFISGLEIESLCADLLTVHPVRHRPVHDVQTFSHPTNSESATEPVKISNDDYGAILLRFSGGARGCLHVSQVSPGRKNCIKLEIAGSKSTLAWNSESPNDLWIGHQDASNQAMIRDPALLSTPAQELTSYPGGHNEGYADSFKGCFRAFYEYIERGDFQAAPTFPTLQDGHREIVLCDALLKSYQEQCWVSV